MVEGKADAFAKAVSRNRWQRDLYGRGEWGEKVQEGERQAEGKAGRHLHGGGEGAAVDSQGPGKLESEKWWSSEEQSRAEQSR